MRLQEVENIDWAGGVLGAYVLLKDGQLEQDSIILAPSLYLLQVARQSPGKLTVRAAGYDLKKYFEALAQSGRRWQDITDGMMSGYLESTLHHDLGLSEKSIQRHCANLNGFYKFAESRGLISHACDFSFLYHTINGETKIGRGKKNFNLALNKKYINQEIFEILLSNVNETPGFLRARDELILEIGLHMGLRASEVVDPLNFKISKIKNTLNKTGESGTDSTITNIFGKGGKKLRGVEMHPIIIEKIRNFLEKHRHSIPGDQLICTIDGFSLSESHASRVFNRAKKISIPAIKEKIKDLSKLETAPFTISFASAKSLTFHCLRHTFTTNLVTFCYAHGIDPKFYVPEQLGHCDWRTTKQYIVFEANVYNRDQTRKKLSPVMGA
ncbi:tyrosine-type recombinase/integrase [Pseudomonas sp. 18058]|uniref:tyrosine-type recombinase/integrase n=1 Tax=Pseudomonas sp. 18058 TaxID=2681406 RepID=UPI001359B56A|nr:tyrosine-type recombinase/integrase [Pseudomonas sp. 18058]